MSEQASGNIIPFPRRVAQVTEDGQERLCRALAGLDSALAAQRAAVASWRQSLADLHSVVSGLGGSLNRYRDSLDALGTRVSGLHSQALELERMADAALVSRAD